MWRHAYLVAAILDLVCSWCFMSSKVQSYRWYSLSLFLIVIHGFHSLIQRRMEKRSLRRHGRVCCCKEDNLRVEYGDWLERLQCRSSTLCGRCEAQC